jgi:hypothetical protein
LLLLKGQRDANRIFQRSPDPGRTPSVQVAAVKDTVLPQSVQVLRRCWIERKAIFDCLHHTF